jgi:hypothetical protein
LLGFHFSQKIPRENFHCKRLHMNERIRLLAEQAGYEKDMFGIGHWDMPECQKFAELIIAECAQACMNEGASYEEKTAGAYQSNLYVTAIKKHFGVEE